MVSKLIAVVLAALAAIAVADSASAAPPAAWSDPMRIDTVAGNSPLLTTPQNDGCPILSPDGRDLYFASNRPGGPGGVDTDIDIYVSHRDGAGAPFGDPVALPEPINSTADDFCPTPLRGGRLLFVSRRAIAGACGAGDIYLARRNPVHGWGEPRHLPCAPLGPNSMLDEQGPSLVETGDGEAQLYFSRSNLPSGGGDIFVSPVRCGRFGPASAVAELNSADNDIQPNVRKDGREIVFSSNHGGYAGAQGAQDIYAATRKSVDDPWSAPVNLGPLVNKAGSETRPSLSWDGHTLLFGRAPVGSSAGDIYVATR
jgi:WD40-like Beta Propeller Repeat